MYGSRDCNSSAQRLLARMKVVGGTGVGHLR